MAGQRSNETTRVLLRSFGVMVTTFEERMTELRAQAAREDLSPEEAWQIVGQALAYSSRLVRRLREVNEHVLAEQERTFQELGAALARHFPSVSLEVEE